MAAIRNLDSRGIPQAEIARRLGVPLSQVCDALSGRIAKRRQTAQRCPQGHGLVEMPCRACAVAARDKGPAWGDDDVFLATLALPARTIEALDRHGIYTVRDVRALGAERLLRLCDVTPAMLAQLNRELTRRDLPSSATLGIL